MQSLHMHTWRCKHATGTMEEYVLAAIAGGITDMGFSDHVPLPDAYVYDKKSIYRVRMNMAELPVYAGEVRALAKKHRDAANIRLGIEMEYVPSQHEEVMRALRDVGVEYIILGQHFLEDGAYYPINSTDSDRWLCLYPDTLLSAAATGDFTFAAHPDLIHYTGSNRALYIREMTQLCAGLTEAGMPLEINLHGLGDGRNYPDPLFWDIAGEMQAPTVLGVDAHGADEVWNKELVKRGREFAAAHHVNLLDRIPEERMRKV